MAKCSKCGNKVYTNNYTKKMNETFIKKATSTKTTNNTITVNGVKYTSG